MIRLEDEDASTDGRQSKEAGAMSLYIGTEYVIGRKFY